MRFKYFCGNFLIHHLFTKQASVIDPLSWSPLSALVVQKSFGKVARRFGTCIFREICLVIPLCHSFFSFSSLSPHAARMNPKLKGTERERPKNQGNS